MDKIAIGKRIKTAREAVKITQDVLSKRAGATSKRGLQENEAGNAIPGGAMISALIDSGINANWVLTGEGEMLLANMAAYRPYDGVDNANPLTAREPDHNYVAIDKYVNVSGSAGPGADVHEEAIVKVRMDARLLRERIGNNFSKIKVASVSGDSMEPTLSHGDQVLVDTSCSRFIDDAIYAIQQDGHLRFKRIQLKLDGSIVVRSDGSTNVETYTAEEAARFFIVGLVIPFKFGRFKI